MNKIAVGILALFCCAFSSFATTPTEKDTNPKKTTVSASSEKESSSERVFFYLKGEFADVESGKTVVYSSLISVSRWEWVHQKDQILENFEEELYESFPMKTIAVGYESLSKDFTQKELAKSNLDEDILSTLNKRANAQFLLFNY